MVDGRLVDVTIHGGDGQPIGLLPKENLDLRAFLLKDLFRSFAKDHETCYVVFRKHFDQKNRETAYLDPPPGFLERFQGRSFQVQPASKYPGEGLSVRNTPDTGIPDGVYTIEIVEWLDEHTARAHTEMFRTAEWTRREEVLVNEDNEEWQKRIFPAR